MTNINYTSALLENEFDDREPIRRALMRLAEQYNIRQQVVVELGSGLGFNLEIFKKENTVTGVEGLSTAADQASKRGIRTITADLALPIPFDSASVDAVLCLDVLEHLVSPHSCLIEARRILRPQGLLAINVPNHFTLSGRINIWRGLGIDSVKFFPDHADWENPHLRFFRHSSIKSLIAHSGFLLQEDWSNTFASVPVINKFRRLRRSSVARAMARAFPALFAGGFFLIARKPG